MRTLRKRIAVVVVGTALTLLQLAGTADAQRTDGVCGGVGSYDPATGQCVEP